MCDIIKVTFKVTIQIVCRMAHYLTVTATPRGGARAHRAREARKTALFAPIQGKSCMASRGNWIATIEMNTYIGIITAFKFSFCQCSCRSPQAPSFTSANPRDNKRVYTASWRNPRQPTANSFQTPHKIQRTNRRTVT